MACTYTIINKDNKEEVFSLSGLTRYYYESTTKLSNSKIYSSDEIQQSTVKEINARLKDADYMERWSDSSHIGVFDLVVKQQPDLLNSIGLKSDRLAPEYIEDERIINYILNKSSENSVVPVKSEKSKKLKSIMKDSRMMHINKEVVNYYLLEIEDILEYEEKYKKIGVGIHNILAALIETNGGTTSSLVNSVLDKLQEKNEELIKEFGDDWKKKILDSAMSIYTHLKKLGLVMSEIKVVTNPSSNLKVRGSIDAVVIDGNGTAHIFDFKVSKKEYEAWDSAKLLHTDWQLMLYKQLLGQHTQVNETTLNVVAIEIKKGKDNLEIRNSFHSRSDQPRMQQGGFIHKYANILLPIESRLIYDPDKIKNLNTTLSLLLPGYKIKVSDKKYNKEQLIEAALERWKRTGTLSFFNDLPTNSLKKGWINIEEKTEEGDIKTKEAMLQELDDILDTYIGEQKENENLNISTLRNKISEVIADPDKFDLKYSSDKNFSLIVNRVLKDYMNGNHRLVKGTAELLELGIILLENINNGRITAISITSNTLKSKFDDELDITDTEYIKVFSLLDEYFDDLGMNNRQIEDIVVFNLDGGKYNSKSLNEEFNMYDNLVNNKGLSTKLKRHNLISIAQLASSKIYNSLRIFRGPSTKGIQALTDAFTNSYSDPELQELIEIRDKMLTSYPELSPKVNTSYLNFDDEVEYIYSLLQNIILIKFGQIPTGDFMEMKQWGIGVADIRASLLDPFLGKDEEYDSKGNKIMGIPGGMGLASPDQVQSSDLRKINEILTLTLSRVREQYGKQADKIASFTHKYFKEINHSNTSQNVLGNSKSVYKKFFVTHKNGTITDEFKTKDPYDYSPDNMLTDVDRKYLKQLLFEIQKYMLGLTSAQAAKVDITSRETLIATDPTSKKLIKKALESGAYFEIPLMRSSQINRYGSFKNIADKARAASKDMLRDIIDPRGFSEEERRSSQEMQLGLTASYDVFGRQTTKFKKEYIAKEGIDHFEIDLDAIANKVAFSKIKKTHVDNKLPAIHAYVFEMKMLAGRQNKDIQKQLNYVLDRLKSTFYDEPQLDPEFEEATSWVSAVKRITTVGILAMRPVLMFKEMTIGMFKGFAIASTKVFGKNLFTMKDLSRALKVVYSFDKQMSTEFNFAQAINKYYGFANMDVNSISEKMKTNRRGIYKGVSRWMYIFNTAPDFYNRMSLFIAKMMHDGSYEAHSQDEKGSLIYDPRKDKRFEYYFNYRDSHVDDKGNYIPAKNDVKFNNQRNHYIILLNELNSERTNFEEKPYTEKDLVDQAYSERERNSFKSVTDMSYGYYDKDAQSWIHQTAFGIMFLQYLQFWPGKMQLWFSKGEKAKNAARSVIKQKTKEVNGKEQLVWRKAIYDEKGRISHFEETLENTSDPLLEVIGLPHEGLISAVGHTLHDVITGNFDEALSNEERMGRVAFAMYDAAMMVILFAIITRLLKGWIADNGTDGIDGKTMNFLYDVERRVLNEHYLWSNTFGAISMTPAFASYSVGLAQDISDTFTGNKDVIQLINQNFGAAEIFALDK